MDIEFIQARNYTNTNGRSIDLLVVHDMEAPETSDRAEQCAQMFATTTREASAHYCIDDDSIVQCVKDDDVAWAAPGGNSDGLQFEFSGYAAQRDDDWKDPFSSKMLRLGAELFAKKCSQYVIPAVYLDAKALQENRRGITTHHQVSLAFRLSTHTDPGVNFPMTRFIGDIRELADGYEPKHHKADLPTIERGDVGWLVKKAQRHLKAHGFTPGEIDGNFDKDTERAVRRFQRHAGLTVDGIVGRETWRKLRS